MTDESQPRWVLAAVSTAVISTAVVIVAALQAPYFVADSECDSILLRIGRGGSFSDPTWFCNSGERTRFYVSIGIAAVATAIIVIALLAAKRSRKHDA